ncbi:MAG: ABC transporter permease [Alphaproteobacteria bacterium]|nr:ABC transporter permease [Alphaproteobacteria bacterium]
MLAFIIRRLIQSIVVMLAVGCIAFSLFQFTGDPINNMVGPEATAETRALLRERLGLDKPFPIQFLRFVGNVVQGEFGVSYRLGMRVEHILVQRLPATLELVAVAAVLALAVGVPLGVYTGLNRYGGVSRLMLTVSLIGISLPTFLIGILLILIFAVWLGWLPSFGRGKVVAIGWWTTSFTSWESFRSLILPAVTLSLFQMTLIMRLVRAEMLEVLRTDYIKFARARGLTNRAVNFGHALKNTLVPVITITGLQIGALIAFAIITETVFQWPGMGLLFLQAIQFVDIPVMSTYLVLVAFLFVIINLTVDLLYYAVDPRLRIERSAAGGH